jgi:hypothetical protein
MKMKNGCRFDEGINNLGVHLPGQPAESRVNGLKSGYPRQAETEKNLVTSPLFWLFFGLSYVGGGRQAVAAGAKTHRA